ncbi:phospholipid-binding protein [Phormidesmis priestleyi]|uniref:phospholipid-binding protein n=1 Tax=Phormidesmis priestleyi TaxID=268141 RepID=UPI00083ABD06|nr:phospholipid-binding protein [Phormidesmis priestleyi]
MGWLQRLFGQEKPQDPQQAISGQAVAQAPMSVPADAPAAEEIPIERVGLNGEYDQSGLAKRVALAFDQDSEVADVDHVYVAQTGSTVVLKGTAPSQEILNKLITIANNVNGASAVDADQVEIG